MFEMSEKKEVTTSTTVRLTMKNVHLCHDYCACVAYIDNSYSVYFTKKISCLFCLYLQLSLLM